jgi:EAL domain-containing protein (putative c-di-GMP-specific phosphodiesterase class I)
VTDDIEAIARKIFDVLAEPADCDEHAIAATATIGAAMLSIEDRDAETVRRNADFALYHAKEMNRGGLVRYAADLGTAMTHRLDAIRDVAAALSDGRIDAYYQPIVRLDTRAIVGLEALCRLITEDGQVVPAAAFQEATSDARVATHLTRRMMTVVAADIRRWLDMGIPLQHVAINVSSADFHGGKLCAELTEAFERQNVPLEHVILEVTESVYISQRDPVVPRAIKAMRAKGLRIALDDFGTGFASLTHLLTVPVDIIKIDKSFIDRLDPNDPSSFIVEGLITIARNLGVRVVAEGVETERQLSQLRDFGCTLGQGYLFSKPVHRDAVTAMLVRLAQSPAEMLRLLRIDAAPQVAPAARQRPEPPGRRDQSAYIRSGSLS